MNLIRIANLDDLHLLGRYETHIRESQLVELLLLERVYIMFVDQVFVGWLRYGLFWDEHPFMNMLYLLDDYRGMGSGSQLVKRWEEDMILKGHQLLMTSTMANEAAQHFFRKLGYKDVGGFVLPNEPLELIMIKPTHKE